MSIPLRATFLLPDPVAGDDLNARLGDLHLAETQAERQGAFRLLECFEGSIRASGHALIEAEGELILAGDDGTLIRQAAARRGDFVADLAEGPVKAALSAIVSPLRALLPVGGGRVALSEVCLLDDQDKTVARADLQRFHPADRDTAVALSSVRALRGYDKAFGRFAAGLRAVGARDGQPASGLYAALAPDHRPYDKKPDLGLRGSASAYDTACAILRAHIALARRTEAGVIADHDTEFLHDYRIGLRKVRSVLSLFKGVFAADETQALKARFSDLMARTGRLRDLDVYLLDRQTYFDLVPDSLRDGLTILFDHFEKERAACQRDLAAWFESPDYAAEIEALTARIADGPAPGPAADRPALGYASALIWSRYRKVCKIARRIDDTTPDAEVHALRIHCKKLRYLMEFFAPLYPAKHIKALIKPLKRLQDTLGNFNDCAVQQDALHAVLAGRGAAKQDIRVAQSVGALIAVLHRRQGEERAQVAARFAHFDSRPIQARFRTLFAEGVTA